MSSEAAPALLVPVTVEALVLVQASANQLWSWARPNYRLLGSYQSVDAQPFDPSRPVLPGSPAFTGVVLHWSLPDGITHGVQAGPEAPVTFPAAPNRWLVVRTAPDADDPSRWRSAAWVVASDVTGWQDGSPYPTADSDGATTLGRAWPLREWPGEEAVGARGRAAQGLPLSAVGPGDAAYAAYVPNVASVFGFADPLTDAPHGPVSYTVVGWYGDPLCDPLYGADAYGPGGWPTVEAWQDLLAALRWSVGDEDDLDRAVAAAAAWAEIHGQVVTSERPHTTHPARTLCHGLITDVTWLGPAGPIVRSVPTANPQETSCVRPTVAVGHNAVDALAATIAHAEADRLDLETIRRLVAVLEAFAHDELGLLDGPDAQARLDLAIQQAWFASTPGGTRWRVVAGEVDDAEGRSKMPLDPDPDLDSALTGLCRRQDDLDAAGRALASAQAEFASAWWKVARLDHWGPPPPVPPDPDQQGAARTALDTARAAVTSRAGGYRYARQARDSAFLALRARVDHGDHPRKIKAEETPPFSTPNDPVLLVTGAHRAFKHGEDHRFSDDGTLGCRFTGQTVDGIEIRSDGDTCVLVQASQVPLPQVDHPDLPPEVADLLAEGFFLDTAEAPLIATVARPEDPWPLLGRIRTEQTLIWNPAAHPALDAEVIAELSRLHFLTDRGAIPSKVGVQYWRPPWSPLFLDWSVTYLPGRLPASSSLEVWAAPADRAATGTDDFSYLWRGEITEAHATSVRGRTSLTPQATDLLAARLRQVIDTMGEAPDLQEDLWALLMAFDHLSQADVLSQALSGFGAALRQELASGHRLPADGSLDPELRPAGAPRHIPKTVPRVTAAVDSFNPIRGGHLRIDKLWVVDGFGQVFDVLGAMHVTPEDLDLVCGPDLTTPGAPALGELKPRLAQPARLRLEWLGADDDGRGLSTDATADPVCGWLVVNRIQRSLLVYAADGGPLGEILATADRARWLPAPQRQPPPSGGTPPVAIGNTHLCGIVEGIVGRVDGRVALLGLLDLIDRAGWTVDPQGGWTDEELPVLIGHPVAVARAALRLDLDGSPVTRQTWADSGRGDDDGLTGVRFPVQLGTTELADDGLVGYYLDDDHTRLDTLVDLVPDDAPTGGYLAHRRPAVRPDGATGALLTLLIDPRFPVHAVTGILPVTSAALPADVVDEALSRITVTFRTGPVLGSGPGVALPLPALRTGTWSWLEYVSGSEPAHFLGLATVDGSARLLDALPVFREGWLHLMLRAVATRFRYDVAPREVPCTTDPRVPMTAALRLSVYNPTPEDQPCQGITWSLPAGAGAGDLAADAQTLAASVPGAASRRWAARVDGGDVILEPRVPDSALAPGETLVVLVAGIPVNRVPGVATLGIAEVTDTTRAAAVPVTKIASRPQDPATTGGNVR